MMEVGWEAVGGGGGIVELPLRWEWMHGVGRCVVFRCTLVSLLPPRFYPTVGCRCASALDSLAPLVPADRASWCLECAC